MELRQGPDLSFVILVVDPYHSSWRIDLCNINLTPWVSYGSYGHRWLHWRIIEFDSTIGLSHDCKGFSNLCLLSPFLPSLRILNLLITKLESIKIYWFYF